MATSSMTALMPLLIVYAIVLVAGVFIAAWGRRWAERIATPGPPVVPTLDPCEVAYLRSGMEESARLAILSLVLDGHIALGEVSISMWIGEHAEIALLRNPSAPLIPSSAPPIVRAVWEWLGEPRTVPMTSDDRAARILASLLDGPLRELDACLQAFGLMPPNALRVTARRVWAACAAASGAVLAAAALSLAPPTLLHPALAWSLGLVAIAALVGGTASFITPRSSAALAGFERPLWALIIAIAVGSGFIAVLLPLLPIVIGLTVACWQERLTPRGRAHVRELRKTHGELPPSPPPSLATRDAARLPILLMIAVTGTSRLGNTPYAYLRSILSGLSGGV